MRSVLRAGVSIVVAAGIVGSAVAGPEGRDPEAVRQAFTTVASRLDQGGDLMIVANVDGLLERYMADLVEIAAAVKPAGASAAEEENIARNLHLFLKQNGFYAVNGLGMSSVPRADGLNVVKTFISRDAQAANLPLWRACVGGAPRELVSLRFMPADTELVRAGTADIKPLWALIQDGVAQVAPSNVTAQFDAGVEMAAGLLGTPVDTLIGSIEADSAVGIQFSQTTTVQLPAGKAPLTMPAPSMLMAIKVKDDTIQALIKRQAAAAQMPLTESQVEGATVYSVALPVPQVPVQLAMAHYDGFLLIGTTTQVVMDAVRAYADRAGLLASDAYKEAFAGQPVKRNGVAYVSDRFGEIMREVQASAWEVGAASSGNGPVPQDLVQRLINRQQQYRCAITMMNYKSGVRASGTSAASGQEVLASMVIAPVGMMAAIAVPSFMKARTTSQKNACINNLRQMDGAKEQWAMAQQKGDGDEPDMAGVCEYIKGGTLPTCPAGGIYELNRTGTAPTCSITGHVLP